MNKYCLVALSIFYICCGQAQADDLLDAWLSKQVALNSWSAKLVQTRTIKNLKSPLQNPGAVWFQRPNQFRWQLGDPIKTIAIRIQDRLTVVYPKLKQIEKYALDEVSNPVWQQIPILLQMGFPNEKQSFYGSYDVISKTVQGDSFRYELVPKSEDLGKLLLRVFIEIDAAELSLSATELVFLDESKMRNVFSNHQYDPQLEISLFQVDESEHSVIEQNQ